MQLVVLITNMLFVLIQNVIIMNEIVQYKSKNAIFTYREPVGLDFGYVRSLIFKQIIHEFVAREKLYRMV
jgi:hypothetical protein